MVENIRQAKSFLNNYFFNDKKYLDFLETLNNLTEYSPDLEQLEFELLELLNKTYEDLIIHIDDDEFNISLRMSLECVMFSSMHDSIMSLIYTKCQEEDDFIFSKCVEFAEKNITAEQFGACDDFAFPLSAGMVELSSLDLHKTPLEKMNCFCTTYDLLYAELKSLIAEFIANTSEQENQIPIVENSDVIPVLMSVIVKSKLLHLYSNLYYINKFFWTSRDMDNISHVLTMFNNAIERLSQTTDENLRPSSAKSCKNLDLKTTLEIVSEAGMGNMKKSESLLDLKRRQIAEQILKATCKDL